MPFCLWLVKGSDKEKLAWAERTGAGVMLTHEVKTSGAPIVYWNLMKKLLAFGYGKPDVAVSPYWEKNHPVKIEGIDSSSLVASKPGAVVVVVCDWGDGGDVCLRVAREQLGLTGKLTGKDLESGDALQVSADGIVRFPLKRHDFRAVLIETAKP